MPMLRDKIAENSFFPDTLVIGVCGAALFDVVEGKLEPNAGFRWVEKMLGLNKILSSENAFEVILFVSNSFVEKYAIFTELTAHGIKITRFSISKNHEDTLKYIQEFEIDLFLSPNEKLIQDARALNCATVFLPELKDSLPIHKNKLSIVFDIDGVLFSKHSHEFFKKHGLQAFYEHELAHQDIPLEKGPLFILYQKLLTLQRSLEKCESPFELNLHLLTARNGPAHLRVCNSLKFYKFQHDGLQFLGGLSKNKFLERETPDIYFEDDVLELQKIKATTLLGLVLD